MCSGNGEIDAQVFKVNDSMRKQRGKDLLSRAVVLSLPDCTVPGDQS